jgi:hypothetical protein
MTKREATLNERTLCAPARRPTPVPTRTQTSGSGPLLRHSPRRAATSSWMKGEEFLDNRSGAAICALMSTGTFGVAEDAAKEVYGLRADVSGDLLPPSPPGEKATASGNQPRETRAHDRTGDKLASDLTTRVSCGVNIKVGHTAFDSRDQRSLGLREPTLQRDKGRIVDQRLRQIEGHGKPPRAMSSAAMLLHLYRGIGSSLIARLLNS